MELTLQRYTWVATGLAIVLSAFLAARTVNTFVGSAIAPRPTIATLAARPQAQSVAHAEIEPHRLASLFGVPLPEPKSAAEIAAEQQSSKRGAGPGWTPEPQKSALHATLVSTVVATPDRFSLCQLTNTDQNETNVYTVDDTFMGARIYQVLRDKVLVVNEGRNEYIDNSAPGATPNLGVAQMPPPSGGDGVKQLSENQYVVAKKEIDAALTNLSDLATKARIVPSFKNGVPNGFKLFSIVPDSLYAKIGVQNGDVIRRINGYEMNSPDKALEIYQKLRDANRIEVEIERRNETIRKSYSIE
jgi:general secretion pathway protein C